jgi:predicted RNA polymerase sigma factor
MRLGDSIEAVEVYEAAIRVTDSAVDREFLRRQRRRVSRA